MLEKLLNLLAEDGVRISLEYNCWVVYRDGVWTIYKQRPYARKPTIFYEGDNLETMLIVAKGLLA